MTDLLDKPLQAPRHPTDAPPRRLSREEIAAIELGHTAIGRRTALAMTVGFLITILSVSTVQQLAGIPRQSPGAHGPNAATTTIDDVRELLPDIDRIRQARTWREVRMMLPTPERLKTFETRLEEQSPVAQWLIPRVQWLLTAVGGVGNEQAIIGRDGWLFFKPGMDYLTGPPFLDERRLARIERFGDRAPNPLPAIVQLHEYLAARGVTLVVMPVPGKAQIHPENLVTSRNWTSRPLQNPSFASLVERLRGAGVRVYDPGPLLAQRQRAGIAQYLATDTHWTPQAMAAVAHDLAAQLAAALPPGSPSLHTRVPRTIANSGDIAMMLKLPDSRAIFPQRQVMIEQIFADGRPWTATTGAPLLLLGDSFANIYSQPELGWGQRAGLAEQLGFALGLPVDRIIINAGGAHATRQRLANELARNPRRLDGVRVVVWEFAQRELSTGDWRLIGFASPANRPIAADLTAAGRIAVRGTIRAIGTVPRPGTVPYRDCLVALHLDGVRYLAGSGHDTELLVFTYGMRNNRLTEAAGWSVGQQVELTLLPWERTSSLIQSTQQAMTNTDADFAITGWWFVPSPGQAPDGGNGAE